MSLSVDSDGWRRLLLGKVQRIDANLHKLAANSHKLPFIFSLLNKYNEVVAEAMGSVTARGGYPVIDFYGHDGDPEKWRPLTAWTVAFKNWHEAADSGQQGDLKEAWDEYADSTLIWEFMGENGGAKGSLSINVHKGMAGLLSGDAATYAQKVEKGGEGEYGKVPARPLFAAVNRAFRAYLEEQLSNGNSPLRRQIMKDLRNAGLWQYGKL